MLGDHSAKTFEPLWAVVATWKCYFYVTDGWSVYPCFIPAGDQIICKTYMTRVEGENTRLRHYLARLHRKTLCYSKSEEMLKHKGSIATTLPQVLGCVTPSLIHIFVQQRLKWHRQRCWVCCKAVIQQSLLPALSEFC